MIKIPENIKALVTYKPGKRAQMLSNDFPVNKIAKLSSNENTLGPSPMAVEQIRQMLDSPNWYPDPAAMELRDKIAGLNGVEAKNVVVGNGSEGLLSNICRAFFEPGDEMLTSRDTFVAIYIMAKANNIPCVTIPMMDGFKYDLNGIADAIGPMTKAIYLANPNNPTGTMFDAESFHRFMARVPSSVLVILDAAYFEYAVAISPDVPRVSFQDYDNVLVLRTFSKAYGLAGMRLGYGIGDQPIIEALLKIKLTFEPTALAQAAGLGALDDSDYLRHSVENNRLGLAYYYEEFTRLGLTFFQSYSNFIMIEFADEAEADRVDAGLIQRGVIVRPLKSFGLPKSLRITVGQPGENEMCVRALSEVLA